MSGGHFFDCYYLSWNITKGWRLWLLPNPLLCTGQAATTEPPTRYIKGCHWGRDVLWCPCDVKRHSHISKTLSFLTKWNRCFFLQSVSSLTDRLLSGMCSSFILLLFLESSAAGLHRCSATSDPGTQHLRPRFHVVESMRLKMCYIVLWCHREQESISF